MAKKNFQKSKALYEKALNSISGGVNSPVRSFSSVNLKQQFIRKGNGPYVFNTSNQKYLDFIGSWGPMLLGHNDPKVRDSVVKASMDGLSFGISNPNEIKLAELIKFYMPSIEKLRFVNSGTEATMSALRVARAYTNRDKIIKFTGNYHGHVDSMLINSGSGTANISTSSSTLRGTMAAACIVAAPNRLRTTSTLLPMRTMDRASSTERRARSLRSATCRTVWCTSTRMRTYVLTPARSATVQCHLTQSVTTRQPTSPMPTAMRAPRRRSVARPMAASTRSPARRSAARFALMRRPASRRR